MATSARLHRQKISTTIAPDTLDYLEKMVESGEAATLAKAIDIAVTRLRAAENRECLERDTAAYFEQMSDDESFEETRLAAALSQSARGIDVDREL
jgi:hypothetical protein